MSLRTPMSPVPDAEPHNLPPAQASETGASVLRAEEVGLAGEATPSGSRSLLDRQIDLSRIHTEWLLYALLFGASIFLHFWHLGQMAMAHDESVHAFLSYTFFTGRGSFNCVDDRTALTYCYNPTYHGPTLYFLTFLSYFLFGASDASARLPQTICGILLLPACYLLRPLLGKRTTLIAGTLIILSPSILYFARYARHDMLALLWTLLMFAGLFRWLRSGGTGMLVLTAVSLALIWATHELVFILIFIFGSFLIFRLLWEWQYESVERADAQPRGRSWFRAWRPYFFRVVIGIAFAICIGLSAGALLAPQDSSIDKWFGRLLGPALLGGAGALLALGLARAWPREAILSNRLHALWATRANAIPGRQRTLFGSIPPGLWWAIGSFLIVFGLLFSTFLAYPRGFLDGWYQGIKYWWFSQQDYARGAQPWYYYLMLLPIYEPMAMLFALGGLGWLSWKGRQVWRTSAGDLAQDVHTEQANEIVDTFDAPVPGEGPHTAWRAPSELLVCFLAYWSILSFIAFSWAGEKMPWLLIQIALPITLLAAWVLSRIIGAVDWGRMRRFYGWSVPLLGGGALILACISAFYLSGAGATQSALQYRLHALPALGLFGATIFGLITVAGYVGTRNVLRVTALTLAGLLLLYGVRAAVQVVYLHPDTPVEPLIFVQTAPDVPVVIDEIRQIAINQTRNDRTAEDPTGGLSMKIAVDPDLAWPFQWYLRDFKQVCWVDFQKKLCTDWDAPIVVLHDTNITSEMRDQLELDHVKTSAGVFNWWFPENGNGTTHAYKDYRDLGPWAVISWPFRPSNWPGLAKFMIYREIPQKLEGRQFEVYIKSSIAPAIGGSQPQTQVPSADVNTPLTIQATLGTGQLTGPRGIATDSSGNLYVADAVGHHIVVFDPSGKFIRTIGSKGAGPGQFNEPSGVSVDVDGNIYVADTWNARVVKLDHNGTFITSWGSGKDDFGEGRRATDTNGDAQANAANPLGFYGPRDVLVVGDRVYIADTGNKRIVVTDTKGDYIEQWGTWGSNPGQFYEPIGLGVDAQGRIYVGDTWNGRIQIFAHDAQEKIITQPAQVIPISGWEKDTYNDPYLAITQDGRVLVSLAGRNAVGVYLPAGTLATRVKADPQQMTGPKGLAVGPDGSIYVVDSGGNQVLKFALP